ncbi:MAG: ATP-binding cassette domain-containing protein [Betaproteobacteria bacterium]|nr:ATP-binding cassette domain-containing protein [Betaproteobacteria bacterium]
MMVEITGLRAGYDGRAVLVLDHFLVAAGQHTLVLGPSGSGKTTLLNIVSGIALPMAGEIRVNGASLNGLTASDRDHFRGGHIGFVMQRLHLISALTVEANLQLAQKLAGIPVDDKRIHAILDTLGIGDKRHAWPRQLSQGEAQRVAISRAVMNRPALILADEPTAALDDANCAAAINLLFNQAVEHGATLLVATHDQRIKSRFTQVLELRS